MELNRAINEHVLGMINAEQLPAIALKAIEDGYDSPSLYQLAGAAGTETNEIQKLFAKVLIELRIPIPSESDAGLALAKSIGNDVIAGRIRPYFGAKRVWNEVYRRFPELVQLRPFVGFASEYEDDEAHRGEYERMIIAEFKSLVCG